MKKALIALTLCSSAAVVADTLTLYTWEAYIDEEVIAQFETATGHTVTQVFYEDEAVREEVITSGRAAAYDLIILDHVSLKVLDNQHLFADLTELQSTLAPMFEPRWANSCGDHGVPYAWGTMGIAYRQSVAQQPISSWQQLFDIPEEHRNRTLMYLDQIDGIAAALMAAGLNPYSNNTDDLKQAYALLQQQQPQLLDYGYGLSHAQEQPDNNPMTLSLSYSGEAKAIGEELGQDDWAYVVPDEGTLLWVDCFTAPNQKPLSAAAQAFVQFINQPQVAAQNAESMWFATPNHAALSHTSEEYRADSTLFPAPEVMANSHTYQPLSPTALRLRSRMLARFQ